MLAGFCSVWELANVIACKRDWCGSWLMLSSEPFRPSLNVWCQGVAHRMFSPSNVFFLYLPFKWEIFGDFPLGWLLIDVELCGRSHRLARYEISRSIQIEAGREAAPELKSHWWPKIIVAQND